MKTLKTAKIRVSVIGLSAEVRVCTVLARETGGIYLLSSIIIITV
jgi:transcription initiation factor TFIIH subunit 2